jgi:hypothetical protein
MVILAPRPLWRAWVSYAVRILLVPGRRLTAVDAQALFARLLPCARTGTRSPGPGHRFPVACGRRVRPQLCRAVQLARQELDLNPG